MMKIVQEIEKCWNCIGSVVMFEMNNVLLSKIKKVCRSDRQSKPMTILMMMQDIHGCIIAKNRNY